MIHVQFDSSGSHMKAENLLKDNKTRSSLKTTETAEGKGNDKPKLDERWYKGHY